MEEIRGKRNIIFFIISYVINNLASGVLYDTYVNYLQEVQISIATSFWAFYGYATFLSAALLLLVPKFGYKKLLVFCSLALSFAFFGVVMVGQSWVLYSATLLALTGVQLHFIMLSPFVACYAEGLGQRGIHWYTRTYYMGYIGYFLATYLGGAFVVKAFSVLAHISYGAAQEATRYMNQLDPSLYSSYMQGNQVVLIGVGILSLLSLLPVLLIKEKKEDYATMESHRWKDVHKKGKEVLSLLLNVHARTYLIYWALISFAMGLFTSYYTVYLNRSLHIDKATSSLMVSISYIAIVVFMFFTPKSVKTLGKVGTIVATVWGSIPFMLLIGFGGSFGNYVVPVVGVSLFIRAGLANLSSPADSALSMDVVAKSLRPVYTGLVNGMAGLISIISGWFTGKILFVHDAGYQYAYFIAAAVYFVAGLVLWLGLRAYNKKENQIVQE